MSTWKYKMMIPVFQYCYCSRESKTGLPNAKQDYLYAQRHSEKEKNSEIILHHSGINIYHPKKFHSS